MCHETTVEAGLFCGVGGGVREEHLSSHQGVALSNFHILGVRGIPHQRDHGRKGRYFQKGEESGFSLAFLTASDDVQACCEGRLRVFPSGDVEHGWSVKESRAAPPSPQMGKWARQDLFLFLYTQWGSPPVPVPGTRSCPSLAHEEAGHKLTN